MHSIICYLNPSWFFINGAAAVQEGFTIKYEINLTSEFLHGSMISGFIGSNLVTASSESL